MKLYIQSRTNKNETCRNKQCSETYAAQKEINVFSEEKLKKLDEEHQSTLAFCMAKNFLFAALEGIANIAGKNEAQFMLIQIIKASDDFIDKLIVNQDLH